MKKPVIATALMLLLPCLMSAEPPLRSENSAQFCPNPRAHLTVVARPPVWTYTLVNDAPKGSTLNVDTFQLTFFEGGTPFVVRATPPGWTVRTDSETFVSWAVLDGPVPSPYEVKPQHSLTGFAIEAKSKNSKQQFTVSGFDLKADHGENMSQGIVDGPESDNLSADE